MIRKFKVLLVLLPFSLQVVFAQTRAISGTVIDSEGELMVGVTVVVVGTTVGTITDIDGKYTLNVQPTDQIQFSFIGYVPQIFSIGENKVIDVTLLPSLEELEEVVVIGYGVQKKASVVGAITQVKGDELKKQGNVANLSEALTGSMPGVSILAGTGLPGGGNAFGSDQSEIYPETEILIRGKATWNNASPLILVDGIERDMNDIDINEVQSISVLKDASATAVYGVKGGNGVILITTKRGSVGKPVITFEANTSLENVSKLQQVEGAYRSIQSRNYAILNEAAVNPNSWADFVPDEILSYYRDDIYPYAFPDNELTNLMLKNFAQSYKVNMNVAGGTEFVKYFGSLSYNHIGDIMDTKDLGQGYNPEYSYDRFNFRSNLDFAITSTTELSANISGYYGIQQTSGASYHHVWYGLYEHAPDWPVIVYEDGIYGDSQGIYERVGFNEYVGLQFSGYERFNNTEINNDFRLDQKLDFITPGLSAHAKLAYDNYFYSIGPDITDNGVLTKTIDAEFYLTGGYWDETTQSYMHPDPNVDVDDFTVYYNPADFNQSAGFNYTKEPLTYSAPTITSRNLDRARRNLYYEAGINYARQFGNHDVTAMALFSRQKTELGSYWPSLREDWVGRVTYNYKRKYMVEFNGSYNGSEKFGPGHKFDFFPSLAVGWTLSNEPFFMEKLPFVNQLKVRYSDGLVGNDRLSGIQWGYVTTWSQGGRYIGGNAHDQESFGNYFLVPGPMKYYEGIPGNSNLQWETAHKRNLGIEYGIFGNLISGSVDVFNEHRTNMLVAAEERVVPDTYGQIAPAANIGEVKSHGIETEVSLRKNLNNSLGFWITGYWTLAANEIIQKEDPGLLPDYQKQAGFSIGQSRTMLESEIIESWDDIYTGAVDYSNNSDLIPGDFRFIDFNSNGVIDPNDEVPHGYSIYPLHTYSFSGGISFKGFSLSVQFYGVYDVTRKIELDIFPYNSTVMYETILNDTWTPEYGNSNPTYPHISFLKGNRGIGSYDNWDASFLRLKNAEISYNFPARWLEPAGITGLRLYANGNNLFIWTDMPVDGEGLDFTSVKNYPVKKLITIGATLQF